MKVQISLVLVEPRFFSSDQGPTSMDGLSLASAFLSSQPSSGFAAPQSSTPGAFPPHNLEKGTDGGGWAVTCRDRPQGRE